MMAKTAKFKVKIEPMPDNPVADRRRLNTDDQTGLFRVMVYFEDGRVSEWIRDVSFSNAREFEIKLLNGELDPARPATHA